VKQLKWLHPAKDCTLLTTIAVRGRLRRASSWKCQSWQF